MQPQRDILRLRGIESGLRASGPRLRPQGSRVMSSYWCLDTLLAFGSKALSNSAVLVGGGKGNAHCGPLTDHRLDRDRAAVRCYYAVTDCQPKTGAATI